jgi:hypothetical protein
MLSPFIIDAIRRLEEKKREQQPQLVLELPLPAPSNQRPEAPEDERLCIIELL